MKQTRLSHYLNEKHFIFSKAKEYTQELQTNSNPKGKAKKRDLLLNLEGLVN